jgi:two-component system response regulator YesN
MLHSTNLSKYGRINELVTLLAIGNIDRHQVEEYLNVLGLGMEKGVAIVVEINFAASEIPVTSSLQKGIIKKRCMEKLKMEFEKEHIKTLVSAVSQFIYLFLFLEKKEGPCIPDNIAQLVAQITERLHIQLNVPLRVGVGNPYDNIDEMCTSFTHARTALHQIKTPSGTSCYFHLKNKKTEQQYPIMKERELYRKIISGDEKEVQTICNELLDWIQTSYTSMEEICRKVSEMMIVVCRPLSMETKLSLDDSDAFIENILKMKSVEMLKAYVFEIIKQTMNEIRSSWSDRSVLLVNKACEYVRTNYMKKITLEDAAIDTGISQYYLSRVFKQVKKLNFVDYLSKIRIEKAKELLKDPSISITEVSNLVGYSDANYFSRVFKRIEEISPSDYRNKL